MRENLIQGYEGRLPRKFQQEEQKSENDDSNDNGKEDDFSKGSMFIRYFRWTRILRLSFFISYVYSYVLAITKNKNLTA